VIGRRSESSAARMAASVLLDRFCGLITFGALAVLLFPVSGIALPDGPLWIPVAAIGAGLIALAALIALPPVRRRLTALREAASALTYARIAGALAWSLASSVSLAATAAFAGALQGVGAALGVAFGFAAAAVTAVIPLSMFGVTLTEVTGAALYQLAGASFDQALAIAASIYLMRLIMALIGGLWILWGRLRG